MRDRLYISEERNASRAITQNIKSRAPRNEGRAVMGHLSGFTLAVGVAVTCVALARVVAEERLLRGTFPEYADYAKGTKALAPYLF